MLFEKYGLFAMLRVIQKLDHYAPGSWLELQLSFEQQVLFLPLPRSAIERPLRQNRSDCLQLAIHWLCCSVRSQFLSAHV